MTSWIRITTQKKKKEPSFNRLNGGRIDIFTIPYQGGKAI